MSHERFTEGIGRTGDRGHKSAQSPFDIWEVSGVEPELIEDMAVQLLQDIMQVRNPLYRLGRADVPVSDTQVYETLRDGYFRDTSRELTSVHRAILAALLDQWYSGSAEVASGMSPIELQEFYTAQRGAERVLSEELSRQADDELWSEADVA